MTFELTPDPEGSEDSQPLVSTALSKATASNPKEANAQVGVGLVLFLALVGLIIWGMASCTGATFKSMGADSARREAQKAAEKAQEANRASDAGYSDVMVISGAQQAVKRKLVDDRSARFRNVSVVVQSSGTKAVCGEVNSKNRVGGYSGYQHFISAGTDAYTYLEEQVPNFSEAWNQLCVR